MDIAPPGVHMAIYIREFANGFIDILVPEGTERLYEKLQQIVNGSCQLSVVSCQSTVLGEHHLRTEN